MIRFRSLEKVIPILSTMEKVLGDIGWLIMNRMKRNGRKGEENERKN